MESRYLFAGLTIVSIALVFTLYGMMFHIYPVMGVSLSALVIGIAVTVIGATYSEPAEDILRHILSDIDMFVVRVLEDMGIVGGHNVKICLENMLAVFYEKPVECRNAAPGIGMASGAPYIAIPLDSISRYMGYVFEGVDLVDMLKKLLIDILGVCRSIVITKAGNTISVELVDLTDKGFEYLATPMNPLRLLIPLAVTQSFRLDVEVSEEILTQTGYTMKLRLLGEIRG